MKILWLNINSSYSHTSLSIAALHAQIMEPDSNIEWRVISGTVNRELSYFVDEIVTFKPDLILSTAWLFNHEYLLSLLFRVKTLLNECTIVLGGPEFLGDNSKYLFCNSCVDAVFRGEGEEIFPQFIRNFKSNQEWRDLPGFCSVDSSGVYRDNGAAEVTDFSSLVPPEKSPLFEWEKPFVQIETSRGCFNRCTFCVSGDGRKVQNIPVEAIKERLDLIHKRGIKEVRVLDRTFNANSKRAISLLKLFCEYSPDIVFHLEIHPSFMNKNFRNCILSLPENLLHIEVGMQSLCNNVIKECNRSGSADESYEGLEYLVKKTKFEIHSDLIAGLPYYSYSSLLNDVRRLILLGPDEIQLESLKLLPGTSLRDNSLTYGIKYSPLPPYEVLQTNHISYQELKKAGNLSKIIEIYINGKILKKSFVEICGMYSDFLDKLLSHYEKSAFDYSSGAEKRALFLWDFCIEYFNETKNVLIKDWITSGYSHKSGAGKELKLWKFKDHIKNPLFDSDNREITYKYVDIKSERWWFSFHRSINSCKPISIFIEII